MMKTFTAAGASGVLALSAVASAAALATASPAQAAEGQTASARTLVSLDIRDARFESAIQLLTAQNPAVQIVFLSPGDKNYQLIKMLKIVDQPFDKALRMIAAAGGAVITQDEGIYYVRPIGATDTTPVSAAATVATAETVVAPATEVKPRSDRQWATIHLIYAMPSDIKRTLSDPDALSMVIEDITKTKPNSSFVPDDGGVLEKSKSIPKYDPNANKPFHIIDDKNPEPNVIGNPGSAGQNDPSFAAAGQRGLAGGFQGGGGGAGGFQGGFQPGGQGGPGGPGAGAGAGQTRNLTPAGIDNIISNDADNTLIVQGDAAGIEELRQIIRLLDVAPKQVIIRAEFVRVNLNDADSFGIAWQFRPTANSSFASQIAGTGASLVGVVATGNAVANLQATLTRSTANILQAPIISTTNNRPAQIVVSDYIPITQSNTFVGANGQQTTNNYVSYVPVQNQLAILPHINGDNSVSLTVSPQLQSFTLVNGLPQVSSQSLTTSRRIANGETMVLGGFITKQDAYATNSIPLLSKLPIIGNIFRSYDHSVQSGEVLVFLTPQIIEDRAQGVVGSSTGAAITP